MPNAVFAIRHDVIQAEVEAGQASQPDAHPARAIVRSRSARDQLERRYSIDERVLRVPAQSILRTLLFGHSRCVDEAIKETLMSIFSEGPRPIESAFARNQLKSTTA